MIESRIPAFLLWLLFIALVKSHSVWVCCFQTLPKKLLQFNKLLHNSETIWKLSITTGKFNTSHEFSLHCKQNVLNRMCITSERFTFNIASYFSTFLSCIFKNVKSALASFETPLNQLLPMAKTYVLYRQGSIGHDSRRICNYCSGIVRIL